MSTLHSPFVGMDPYLEEPALWSSIHTRLMTLISDFLADLVAPDFYVDIQQYVTVLDPDDPITLEALVLDQSKIDGCRYKSGITFPEAKFRDSHCKW